MIALIPARAGSKRIPHKNMRLLAGHPLLAYTIAAAQKSGVFSSILVATNSQDTADHALSRGASVRVAGPPCHTDTCCDITWVTDAMRCAPLADSFAILRPTSPFRTAETIQRAFAQFSDDEADSLRAVEPWTGPHPGKMWYYDRTCVRLSPVWTLWTRGAPYHSSPTQSLVPVFKQNACLEMAWTRVLRDPIPTISGDEIAPFFTQGYEGVDLNTPEDWTYAETLLQRDLARLPDLPPYGDTGHTASPLADRVE